MVGERSQLDRELGRLEEERNQLERQSRTLELALSLRDRWAARASLDERLAELGPIRRCRKKCSSGSKRSTPSSSGIAIASPSCAARRGQLRTEAASITLNEALLAQFARIEALQEQESWYTGVNDQIAALEPEIARLESAFSGQLKELGLNEDSLGQMAKLSERSFAALRSPAERLHERAGKARSNPR